MAAIKRGSSLCEGCGTSNENRAIICKGCGKVLTTKTKRPKPEPIAQYSSNVTSLLDAELKTEIKAAYSVRVRLQGPDYRCFVTEGADGAWKCTNRECVVVQQGRARSISDIDNPHDHYPVCSHVEGAIHGNSISMPLELKLDTLSSFPFPTSVQQTLKEMVSTSKNMQPAIIQRVSEKSFVIRSAKKSFQTPLKLLHIRFDSQNRFHCQCSQFKKIEQRSSAPTAPKLSKRCIHLYICMWAFLSCQSLQQEFSMYLHQLEQGEQSSVSAATHMSGEQQTSGELQTNSGSSSVGIRESVNILLKHTKKIPESQAEIKPLLSLIQEKNVNLVLQRKGMPVNGEVWKTLYQPSDTKCVICNNDLGNPTHLPGSRGKSWLVCSEGLLEVEMLLKQCKNPSCRARHSFRDWKTGVFNVSNKLLVCLDVLLRMREHIQKGEPPGNCADAVVHSSLQMPYAPQLPEEQVRYVVEKLYDGFFAFEALTDRDWDLGICGICGICPLFESGDGNCKNCTPLTNSMVVWPVLSEVDAIEGTVDVDKWWTYVDSKVVEAAVFRSSTSEPVSITDIAPWIPPSCRSSTILNTEHLKAPSSVSHLPNSKPFGCPKKLAELVRKGNYNPLESHNIPLSELKVIAADVEIPSSVGSTKPQLLRHLDSLYSFLIQGKSECHTFEAVPKCSGGKIFRNCHHQVVSAAKYVMRKESTRDHVDLLLSSKHWPVVFAVDMACDVAAHVEVRRPNLANALWGERRACFQKPHPRKDPQVIRHPEFSAAVSLPTNTISSMEDTRRDHTYCKSMIHPLTNAVDRYIVGDRFHDGPKTSGHKKATCKYHHIDLCPELANFQSITSEVLNSKIKSTRLQSSNQQNLHHYFFYNRLMDHWNNLQIVHKQWLQMHKRAKPGETVTRDVFRRFCYVCTKCHKCGHIAANCLQ